MRHDRRSAGEGAAKRVKLPYPKSWKKARQALSTSGHEES